MTSRELHAPCPVLPYPQPSYSSLPREMVPAWEPTTCRPIPAPFHYVNAVRSSSRLCRHFARGTCTWGASCRFSHDFNDAGVSPQSISAEPEEEELTEWGRPTQGIVIAVRQHQPYCPSASHLLHTPTPDPKTPY